MSFAVGDAEIKSAAHVEDPAHSGQADENAQQLMNLLDGGAALVHEAHGPSVNPSAIGHHHAFLNALGVALYTTDAQGRITFYNNAAADFWGRRPELDEEWCGSLRLMWPDGRPMAHSECPMAVALRENRAVRGAEALAERPDGSHVWFVPYPTPIHDATDTLIGAVNVLVDVTERRRAEDALREVAHALQVSNAVKDEFLGLVSHELRTPVTTILGNAQLLRDRGSRLSEQDRHSMLSDIAGDAERLRAIVENLLLLTRLESGSGADPEPQVLAHVMRKAIDAQRAIRPQRPITLHSQPLNVIVESDSSYLEMVIDNLLSNADKYSPPGSPIEVVLQTDDEQAQVLVLDRGIGISEEDAERIFAPFYRAESARGQANGVGIGLAVCRRVVESLGGRIWARPRPGGGAELGFALPLAADTH